LPIFDRLPDSATAFLQESPLLSVRTDIDEHGRFGERYVVLTSQAFTLLTALGDVVRTTAIADVTEAKLETGIGGGALLVETAAGPIVLARFSAGLARKFGVVAEALTALVKGEQLPTVSERDLPRLCATCGRPLAEGTNVCPVCVDKGKVVRRLLRYGSPYKWQMIVAGFFLILATLVQLVPPYLTKLIVDNVLSAKTANAGSQSGAIAAAKAFSHPTLAALGTTLLWLVLALLFASFLGMVLQTLRGYLAVWFGSRIMGDIRHDVYQALMGLSLSYFDRRQTSQFIGRVNSDAESMRQFLTDGLVFIVGQVLMIISILIVLLELNWQLALFAFLTTPLVLVASAIVWPFIRRLWYGQWRAILRLNILVGDSLSGIRVVKAFGQEDTERARYGEANRDLVIRTTRIDGLWQGIFPAFAFITGIGGLLVWYFGGLDVLHDQMTIGTLIAFTAYLGMFFGPMQWFSQLINWANTALAAADRVFEILDTRSEVAESPDAQPLPFITGHVELRDVSFGYEKHRPVLKKVSLKVAPGEMIGLVGHSGAGKSTLINLIARFYDPDTGAITIDGADLRKIKMADLHRQIGVVLQETFLFDGTVYENISYGNPNANPEQVIRAAKIANAHKFILLMQDGYDTRVGERGHRLSGGEKQRIAIARAVLHDPRILILDEATASLDTETERQIQEALARLVKGRTTFAIAHRLSTLRNADRLVVIDKGEVAEMGSHEELLRKKGIYHRLVQAQREMSRIRGIEG